MMVDYKDLKSDFYDEVVESNNLISLWFHRSRSLLTGQLVDKYYQAGMVIADLGCGNVLWNTKLLPVVGVDVNEDFLNHDLRTGRINKKVVSDLDRIDLPDDFADIIIITEVLEHLPDLAGHLREMRRILKPGGIIISSVPYDTFFSLWQPLFAVQCFYRGRILGEKYYREKCGHINHFSPKTIAGLFGENNFSFVERKNMKYFNIFTVVKKI